MRWHKWMTAALLIVLCNGCLDFTLFSWSPDGRYVAVVNPDDSSVAIWDTVMRESKPILQNRLVSRAAFLGADRLLVLYGEDEDDTHLKLATASPDGSHWQDWPYRCHNLGLTVSADRKTAYVADFDEDAGTTVVYEVPVDDPDAARTIYESESDVHFPAVNPARTSLLLAVYDEPNPDEATPAAVTGGESGNSESSTLVHVDLTADPPAASRILDNVPYGVFSPIFVDDRRFAYVRAKDADTPGDLVAQSIGSAETRMLTDNVYGIIPLNLSHDKSRIVATKILDGPELPVNAQAVAVGIESGEVTQLTNDPMGAAWSVPSPVDNRVAHMVITDNSPLPKITDPDAGQTTVVWRDEEERLYAAASRFKDAGDYALALRTYEELLFRFPESGLSDAIWYDRMLIHLAPPVGDLDAAMNALQNVGSGELQQQATDLLWREADRVANDPTGDLIRTYATDASRAKYEYDTDAPRDLTGLWARWSEDRLYLRIGVNSPNDAGGLVLRDLMVLMSQEEGADPAYAITPLVQWDRTPFRTIVLHHWFDAGANSQYGIEILDGNGEISAQFTASGFPNASFPIVSDLNDQGVWPDDAGAIVLSISRDALDLTGDDPLYVQVCTTKGGVDSIDPAERPREAADSGDCDIADAFGETNTRERIDAAIAAGEPVYIRGHAAVLTPP